MHPYNHHLIFVLLLMTKKQKPNNSCCQFSKEECSLEWRGTIVMAFDKPKRCGECPACRSGSKRIPCEVPESVRAQREREQRSEALLGSQNPQSWNPC